uniref:Uncharacterized protein n=1 Tax=Anguilla anguilla TaxID=7936 RepID=A0A0E9P6D7_ANGAN
MPKCLWRPLVFHFFAKHSLLKSVIRVQKALCVCGSYAQGPLSPLKTFRV